jgi:6-phosphofructokinase 1
VAVAAKAAKLKLSIVHVPKTIFDDLPLPDNARTFGFDTARQVGCSLVQMFAQDAATMVRWYLLTCVGVESGHLTLGIGKAAAAHLTIVPEEFQGKKVVFNELVDMVEATIYKRRMHDNNYGVAVLCEGLVDLMDKKEIQDRFGGDVDAAHQDLGRHISNELQNRFKKAGVVITTVARNIGTECRAADPSAADILLSRDLGFGAARLLLDNQTGCIVSIKAGAIHALPLTDIIDPNTGKCALRRVDVTTLPFIVAQNYMVRLKKSDLKDVAFVQKIAASANMTPQEFIQRFEYCAL